jgi:integrase
MKRRGHNEGSIDERSPGHYRLRYRIDGQRYTVGFKGSLADAKKEMRRLLRSGDDGVHVAPDQQTVADYLRAWLSSDTNLSPGSIERYQQLAEHQVIPHLGSTLLQKLRPKDIADWHAALLKSGLHRRSITNAHGMLRNGLQRAVRLEIISRNVTSAVAPPKVPVEEVEILSAEQIAEVLARIEGHPVHPIAALSLATGMRRGELCALQWGAVDLDKGQVRVERNMEQTTAGGLRLKSPKTNAGRRSIGIPPSTVETLRGHYREQVELRLRLGIGGRPGLADFVFTSIDGSGPWVPSNLSVAWLKLLRAKGLPHVRFHALRHTHASALIAAGLDIVKISKRLGHSNPTITLRTYAHLFDSQGDDAAADAIERMFKAT